MAAAPRDILAATNAEVLRRFATTPALLAFDFDGTLAPIGADPSRVRPRAVTRRLLIALARGAPVAVITGRAVTDVRARLGPAVVRALVAIVGNHGIEPSPAMRSAARDVAAWRARIEPGLAAVPGVVVEDKRYSLAIHHRGARDRRAARAAVLRATRGLSGDATVTEGHLVTNVVPAYAPDKGDALRRLKRECGVPATLFVGDDVTDEPAFRAANGVSSLGVRVGRRQSSAARWYLRSQGAVDDLLRRLLDARPG